MTKSNTENHRGSRTPLLARTGKLLGNISCDLTEEKNENRFVRTVSSNFSSFMWILKQFNVVNETDALIRCPDIKLQRRNSNYSFSALTIKHS